jgi:hypothetical protein
MASIVDTGKICEDGYVLLATVLLLLMLTIIGVAAIQTATVEIQLSGNNRRGVEEFYYSEGSLITVLENSHWWLKEDFINSGAIYANWSRELDFDEDGTNDALVEVRCIEPTQSNIAGLSRAANDIPADRHIAPPPINSGYSLRYFKIRKYAVTATDLSSGMHLQSGVWKVFGEF